ncbi:MAG: VOC family protein [Thermoleophilaceae bacterium]|jgi:catechol 2,3-dioxygenase-like lactoylglutathione lyase family enzyme|nr:VOC family protein [Thermoleophilaceae bacterium]
MGRFDNRGLDHVAIGVADVERSQRFYEETLGLERVHEAWDVPIVMAAEGTGVAIFPKELHPSSTPDSVEAPAVRILHIAFRLDRAGFDSARSELAEMGVQARFSDHGISHSLYLRDPDGHQIELTTYDLADGADQTLRSTEGDP